MLDADDISSAPLDELIKMGFQSALADLHVWLPVQVAAISGNQKVDVQPLLQRRYNDGSKEGKLVTRPVIRDVPVLMPRGNDYFLKLPIAVGDTGIALFCDRSLDRWLVSGGIVDPADPRCHSYSDAAFIPGLYPFSNQLVGKPEDLVLKNGNAEMTLIKDGTFKMSNGKEELVSTIIDLIETLTSAQTPTMSGPQGFIPTTIQKLNDLKTNLTKLKGK